MPIDWLMVWLGAQSAGFVFRPVMEHLASKAAEGWVTDFLKGCIKNVLKPKEEDTLTTVVGKGIGEFLNIVQQELEGAGVTEEAMVDLNQALQQFLFHRDVLLSLRAPLVGAIAVRAEILADAWNDLQLSTLPPEFSWTRIANRYTKNASEIARNSDELRPILDSKALQRIAATVAAGAPLSPDADLRRYQRAMLKAYGHLKLESLDASTYDVHRIRLDQVFVAQDVREVTHFIQQVFELPKEHQRRFKTHYESDVQTLENIEVRRFRRAYFKQPAQSVIHLLQDGRKPLIVVLGDPGSGKSSLLQVTVLEWAEYTGTDIDTLNIPLLIELKEYARNRRDGIAKDFLEYLHQGAGVHCRLNQNSIADRLKSGKASLLLDGLDEVFDAQERQEICSDIARFSNDYPSARIVVTSRVIGYKSQTLRDAGFFHFMLQDLNDKQIEAFLKKWHTRAYSDSSDRLEKEKRLQSAITDSASIRELAGNPLLLTMMALLNRAQELPRDRASLYEQCSRLLLYQWKAEEALRADERFKGILLDFKDKSAMLRRVARVMQSTKESLAGNLISEDILAATLNDVLLGMGVAQPRLLVRAVIDHLRSRNFILCYVGGDNYAFVHRTFLEYFCASDFLWQFKEERSIDLQFLKHSVFGLHWSDERWAEILTLISGMLVPKLAGELVSYLLSIKEEPNGKCQHAVLAARSYAEIRNKGELQKESVALKAALKEIATRQLPPKYKKKKNRDLQTSNSDPEQSVSWRESGVRIREARLSAMSFVTSLWPDDEEIYSWLKDIAINHEQASVRDLAFQTLAKDKRNLPATTEFFLDVARNSSKPIIRLAALSNFAKRPDRDNTLFELSLTLVAKDSDPTVQMWAIEHLTDRHLTNSKTLDVLIAKVKEVQFDGPMHVRARCFRALNQMDAITNEVIGLAKKELCWEITAIPGGRVKRAAISLLEKHSKVDPDAARLIINAAECAGTGKTKKFAINALKRTFIELSEVRQLLENIGTQ